MKNESQILELIETNKVLINEYEAKRDEFLKVGNQFGFDMMVKAIDKKESAIAALVWVLGE